LAEQIAREMLSGSPPANEEVQAPPEGSKIARVDAVIAALESRTLTVSGHVPSTAARVVLVLDGEAPRKHIKYTVMYVDGMGGDQWKPFSLEIRVPEIGNGATVVGDGMTVDVRF
jgi:hypothetical protein